MDFLHNFFGILKLPQKNCLKAEMESKTDFGPLINFVIDRSFGVGIKDGGGRDLPSLEKVAM